MTTSAFAFTLTHGSDDSLCVRAQLANEAATLALGARLAPALAPGLKIWLEGDLGSGKTTLVRGILRASGYVGTVKSPTYTLVEPYVVSGIDLYHFDFYRLTSPEEFLDAGLDEYFSGAGVCLMEWPQQALPYLPQADVVIALTARNGGRHCTIRANTETGQTCITQLADKTKPE
ncbi:MAG: tRNA (adenosine(37)-N6)-threonylcarbamoyltransferase complex ATPase subunit type 1 TsaE [Azoarcus sp.]|jgi:tRNA threonylcarbamoyladenosine biosynthesis protein TsaE|nr:tRNA (adenosine(37)-N6)-threonylcarbamoyltransferase complex ATPase subunit type 1 TsaE [Azoarcus sp.]